jgi:BirA family biotin operon repressor/biotin-[acetyl-CoA-carboxylase] ligase
MAVAIAAQRFFQRHAQSEVSVKWPNDLYWRDRKAGGILIENILHGSSWKAAVVGLGININQTVFDGLSERAVSLKQVTGRTYEITSLVRELYAEIEKVLEQLNNDKHSIVNEYHAVLFKRLENVKFKKGNRIFEAIVKGVSNDGELIVDHGMEERFQVGDIEWVF